MKAKYITILLLTCCVGMQSFAQDIVTAPAVNVVPNYAKNFEMFLALCILTFVLVLAIMFLANNIKTLVSSDFYRQKLAEKRAQENNKNSDSNAKLYTLLAVVGLTFWSSSAMAISFNPVDGGNGMPWLRVEKSDLTLLLTLDIVLLFVVFYLRKLFNQLYEDVRTQKAKIEEKKVAKSFTKINAILTDAVPFEYEDQITLDHEYDGIKELDNNLPPWWVVMFFLTILFGIGYVCHYHIFKTGELQIAEYKSEIKKADADVQEYLDKMAMNVDETNATLLTSEDDLSTGRAIYKNNCIVCHKENGEGDIGPNLTDDYWIYTGDIKAIFGTIKKGTSNGMPEHASKLNPIQIQQVASYVWNLPFVAGKEPQGEKYIKENPTE